MSDWGPKMTGSVVESPKDFLGINRVQAYPFQPQPKGTVERRNRTIIKKLASFMATATKDWDDHVTLACFSYNTGVFAANNIMPYKYMFVMKAFQSLG